jgi:hypothetical protein
MDIINIAGLNSLASDYYSRLSDKQVEKPEADKEKDQTQKERLTLEKLHNTGRIRRNLLQGASDLNLSEARGLISQLAPMIAQAPSWKLSELQAVVESNLIPETYA